MERRDSVTPPFHKRSIMTTTGCANNHTCNYDKLAGNLLKSIWLQANIFNPLKDGTRYDMTFYVDDGARAVLANEFGANLEKLNQGHGLDAPPRARFSMRNVSTMYDR